ncbi:TIGR04282 family arsenosugar biosynthesis glycosyltransferase [Mariniflexile sp. AS56]|uniref:TIGR04282 family arsenosugar biosynthesis glycosyltransferase n=1 Tax=Mariniflexile sp. AS56 TaxID=3063957 RepID=UPI0026EACD6D|nr:TIGR04282 family arsenosugar biosynthesis glycosyltransferase [Mariniflexile sp. AS56]MDO7170822.1 TIGR04282 family arsenosugar biosynthesis glycosyltransferase [Mariniflexile sp. AS56]
MTKELVIVFVKNIKLGKVKTRLAKTIGNQAAFEVYTELVKVTEKATKNLPIDTHIYFSEAIVEDGWEHCKKAVQEGVDLGERMKNAFKKGFDAGYERIVLIGSDLPDINSNHIETGLQALNSNNVVFGPALDGGYYLVGFSKFHECVFQNKPWSQPHLLEVSLTELKQNNVSFTLLDTLNDIDTFDDLKASHFYTSNNKLKLRIQQLND